MKNVILQSLTNCKLVLGEKFAVGCSGGVDSISLCFALKIGGLSNFVAIICNHNIRQNAGAEALEVQNYLQQNGIEAVVLHLGDFEKTKNIENNARKARQNAMFGYCLQNNISNLLLAHHKNDAIETFLMRLERGTGLAGLCGIETQSSFCCSDGENIYNINILRPFIDVSKKQIVGFATQNNLQTWQDQTNADVKIRRNFVRNFMEQEKSSEQILQNISTTISNLQSENNFVKTQFATYFNACVEGELLNCHLLPCKICDNITLNVDKYKDLYPNIRHRILGLIIDILHFARPKIARAENKLEACELKIFEKLTIRACKLQNLDNFLLHNKLNQPFYSLGGVKIVPSLGGEIEATITNLPLKGRWASFSLQVGS